VSVGLCFVASHLGCMTHGALSFKPSACWNRSHESRLEHLCYTELNRASNQTVSGLNLVQDMHRTTYYWVCNIKSVLL
jgi:hypothetical protein